MYNDSFLMAFLSNLLRMVPTLLVCIGGIAILQTRGLPKKAKAYGISGLALLLLDAMGSVAFSTFVSSGRIDYSGSNFQVLQLGYSAISQIVYAVALILLVMAICNKEQTATPKSEVENPYGQ